MENDSENKQTGLFDNMSNKEIEGFTKIGERIIDKIKASDEKFQSSLDEELKGFESRDLDIYNNGRKTGLNEGKKEGRLEGAGTILIIETIMGILYYLYNKNKNS